MKNEEIQNLITFCKNRNFEYPCYRCKHVDLCSKYKLKPEIMSINEIKDILK